MGIRFHDDSLLNRTQHIGVMPQIEIFVELGFGQKASSIPAVQHFHGASDLAIVERIF